MILVLQTVYESSKEILYGSVSVNALEADTALGVEAVVANGASFAGVFGQAVGLSKRNTTCTTLFDMKRNKNLEDESS